MAHYVRIRGKSHRRLKVNNNTKVSFKDEATVNLDDTKTQRYLHNVWGDFYSVPNYEMQLTQLGTATVATTASGLVLRAPKDLVVRGVVVTSAVAPLTNPIIVDVKKVPAGSATTDSGTATVSIFAGTANRPSIATAAFAGSSVGTAAFGAGTSYVNWAKGSYLRIEIPQVGSAPTGDRVTVQILADLPPGSK